MNSSKVKMKKTSFIGKDSHVFFLHFGQLLGFEFGEISLAETNIAPENQWLEDEFPFGNAYFRGIC